MEQDSEDPGLARNIDPDTSHAAARSVDSGAIIRLVYRAMMLHGSGGCIADDVGYALPNIGIQTYTPRFAQMVDRGMIETTGKRRKSLITGRYQNVRRVLPPPFIPLEHISPACQKTIINLLQEEIDLLQATIAEMLLS
jgi:hypothetical protein